MSRVTSPSRNSRWIFRSSGALPFWTSLAIVVRDCLLWALGGAGGAADAVPARAAPQQDHHVPGRGPLPHHVLRRSGGRHHAALQVLGEIALMVHLADKAGGQAKSGCRRRSSPRGGGLGDLPLGQLARQGVRHRRPGVAAAGEPHGPGGRRPGRTGDPGCSRRCRWPRRRRARSLWGWLWVSFLNISSQSCGLPSTWAETWMEQALISSLSSSSGSSPRFFRALVPMVAMSMRVWGRWDAFSLP